MAHTHFLRPTQAESMAKVEEFQEEKQKQKKHQVVVQSPKSIQYEK